MHDTEITQQTIRDHQITCLLATHDLEIALHHGNRIVALHRGEILKCIESKEKQTITEEKLKATCY